MARAKPCDRCQRRKATHAAHCYQGRAALCPRCLAAVSHAGDVHDYPVDIRVTGGDR